MQLTSLYHETAIERYAWISAISRHLPTKKSTYCLLWSPYVLVQFTIVVVVSEKEVKARSRCQTIVGV